MERLEYEKLRKSTRLPLVTVYKHPKDYPEGYVARVFDLDHPTMLAWKSDTLEGVRKGIPLEMRRMGRHPGDDPVIVEVWV